MIIRLYMVQVVALVPPYRMDILLRWANITNICETKPFPIGWGSLALHDYFRHAMPALLRRMRAIQRTKRIEASLNQPKRRR